MRDLRKLPWSADAVRVLVLIPGYRAADRTIDAGTQAVTANFDLETEPWYEVDVRLEDSRGAPIAGEEITCLVSQSTWARAKSDGAGCARFSMARSVPMVLATRPRNARPVKAFLNNGVRVTRQSVTLPILPAIRGRVVDTDGRAVPNAAVGRWLTFSDDRIGEMLKFFSAPGLSAIPRADS